MTSPKRPRLINRKAWEAHLKEWAASGMTATQYAKEKGISVDAFRKWISRAGFTKAKKSPLPVKVSRATKGMTADQLKELIAEAVVLGLEKYHEKHKLDKKKR